MRDIHLGEKLREAAEVGGLRELNRQCYLLECGLLVVRVINERLVENKTLVLW